MQKGKPGQEQVGGQGWGAATAWQGSTLDISKAPLGGPWLPGTWGLSWREKALDMAMEHSSSYYSYDLFTLSVGCPQGNLTGWLLLPICSKEMEAQRGQATCSIHHTVTNSRAGTFAPIWRLPNPDLSMVPCCIHQWSGEEVGLV